MMATTFQRLVETKLYEQEGCSVGDFLQAKIHEGFTVAADKLAQLGILDVESRIAISSAIGDALETFRKSVEEKAGEAAATTVPSDLLARLVFEKKGDVRL